MHFQNNHSNSRLRGWILDIYPSTPRQMNIWILTEDGQRIHLVDEFRPTVYVSDKENELNSLFCRLVSDSNVDSVKVIEKFANPTDSKKSKVLEVVLKNYQKNSFFVRRVLQFGRYLRFQVHNCDLRHCQV